MYLCGDLGGTNATFAVFNPANKAIVFRAQEKTEDYEDFYELLDVVLQRFQDFNVGGDRIKNTTLGVAGPTKATVVRPTNIEGWEISIANVSAMLEEYGHGPSASILNDFEALGYGILYLLEQGFSKKDFEPIFGRFKTGQGRASQDVGTRSLVCGPGTGLGVSCVVEGLSKGDSPYIFSSEGGHHSLPPESADQYRFLGRSGKFHGKRSYEEVLSGPGLRNIYNFYRRADYNEEPSYGIAPEEIVSLAKMGRDQAATDSVEFFCETLASFCGNMALTFNCDRSIFLWGSTLTDISRDLLRGRFKRHFADRCNHSDRVNSVSVVLIKNLELPILGCAHCAHFEEQLV